MLTSMPGGAMSPTLLPTGSLVFASPVPKIGRPNSSQPQSALYVQSPGGRPRQLTFSSRSITEPTMLGDGRILFVSTLPPEASYAGSGPALFTINNDGTEITAFAGPEDRRRHSAAPIARRRSHRLSGFKIRLRFNGRFGGIRPHGAAVSKPRAAVSRCGGARPLGGGREQWRFAGVR